MKPLIPESAGYLLLALAAGLGVVYLSGEAIRRGSSGEGSEELGKALLYIPDRRVLHAAALGDDALAADILWLRTVFYIAATELDLEEKQGEFHADLEGKTEWKDAPFPKSFEDADFSADPRIRRLLFWNANSNDIPQLGKLVGTVTDLNPRFVTPYVHGAMNLAVFAGRFDEAIALLDKGAAHNPDRWEPFYYRGFLRLFARNDKSGAARDVQTAAMIRGTPAIVVQLAGALGVGAGERDHTLEFLRSLRDVTDDAELRRKIDNMLTVYGAGAKAGPARRKDEIGIMFDSILNQEDRGGR